LEEQIEIGKIWENCGKMHSMTVDQKRSNLFYGTMQCHIKVYDLKKNFIVKVLKGHQNTVWTLKVSNDSSYLVSGGSDGMVFIWDLQDSFKRVQSFFFGKNVYCVALGPLNRNLYIAGSEYKSIKRIDLKNILKASPEEFNKTLELKRQKGKLSKNKKLSSTHYNSTKKDSKANTSTGFSSSESITKDALNRAFKGYESWITTLENKDQEKVKALIMKSAMMEDRYLKLKVEVGKKNMSEILKAHSENQLNGKSLSEMGLIQYSSSSNSGNDKNFSEELVQMIRKYNNLLNEKKIMKKLIINMKQEMATCKMQTENNNQIVSKLLKESEKLRHQIHELNQKNSSLQRLVKVNKDRNRLLNMKNKDNLRLMARIKNEMKDKSEKLSNWKKISKEFEREVTLLKKKLFKENKNQTIVKILEQKNTYQTNYINILEHENFKLKIKDTECVKDNKKQVSSQSIDKLHESFGETTDDNNNIVFDTFQMKPEKSNTSIDTLDGKDFHANQMFPMLVENKSRSGSSRSKKDLSLDARSSRKNVDEYWKAQTLPLKHKSIMKRRSNSLTSIMKPKNSKKKKDEMKSRKDIDSGKKKKNIVKNE
jgi:hypothetical protein